MAIDYYIKRHDTAPPFRGNLTDGNGDGLNLADVTSAVFIMRTQTNSSVTGNKIDRQPVTIENATTGLVRYDWAVGDTDTSGIYQAEIELTKLDGSVETVPNDGYTAIAILDDLG